ncbi:MAG: D-alanine--D-alanine ligase [Betaproteobacteria bacterium]|nr:D-alanine--D-alanine ligase [Betaproteobacteria bacterium]
MNANEEKSTGFGRVAVIFGGISAEREVSLESGARVLEALLRQKVDAHAFDPATRALEELKGFDRAFIVLHGGYGENGVLQGALEMFRVPYTGSGVLASALGMDKWRSKLLWQSLGLPVPECRRLDADSDFAAVEQALGLPLFVKPASEGSSVGVVKVKESGALAAAYAEAVRSAPPGDMIIAERGIVDGEYTVAILGETALPVIRIEPEGEFYDYHAKYVSEKTRYLCPCGLPPEREAQLREQALAAFAAIGGRGWGRVDFLCDAAGKAYFLEANTVPGMTTHSLVPMAARAAGIDFDTLVLSILARASLE